MGSESKRCIRCSKVRPIVKFRASSKCRSGRENVCVDCTNQRVRDRRAKTSHPRIQVLRKLPSYEVLRRHVVEEGMSLADIGEKYDVTKAGVHSTLRRRAIAHNDWPLPRRVSPQELAMRGFAAQTVNPLLIVGLVFDWLNDNSVLLKDFCEQHRFSGKYLLECRRGKCRRMSHKYAVRLLTAVGEPIPESLQLRSVKYTGTYPRGPRNGRDIVQQFNRPGMSQSSTECDIRDVG